MQHTKEGARPYGSGAGSRQRTDPKAKQSRYMHGSALERVLLAHANTTGNVPRKTGKSWRVTCPVCQTKTYKGSVTEAGNGAVLVHYFCGHLAGEALAACGLQLADLYDLRELKTLTVDERHALRQSMRVSQWNAALAGLAMEASVILIAANTMADGKPLTEPDRLRVAVAALRIFDAAEVLNVGA